MADTVRWLRTSVEPWTRCRALVDLLERPEGNPEVRTARSEMLAHRQVRGLIDDAATWPGFARSNVCLVCSPLDTVEGPGLRPSDGQQSQDLTLSGSGSPLTVELDENQQSL